MDDKISQAAENLSEWLSDPRELGCKPSKIEYTQTFTDEDGIECMIFRYKKSAFGKWLLGIVSDSGTFSEMLEYNSDTAKADASKILETLKSFWKSQAAQSSEDNQESSQKVLKQDLSEKSEPGLLFMMHLLFKDPVSLPDKDTMTKIMSQHLGDVDCFGFDDKMALFAAKNYTCKFKDAEVPPQLMIFSCNDFDPETVDELRKSQMWDCMDDRDRILSECRYEIIACDMMADALPAKQRAELDMDYMEALTEIFKDCEAVYFEKSGKMFKADNIRHHKIPRENRFIYFAVNVRFFNIQSTDDMVVDTVGMDTLFLPDIQYHFHGLDPDAVVNHAYNMADYIFQNDCPIKPDDTIDGLSDGRMSPDVRWKCRYEDSLIQPSREVIDVNTGINASGTRE